MSSTIPAILAATVGMQLASPVANPATRVDPSASATGFNDRTNIGSLSVSPTARSPSPPERSSA